MKCGKSKSSFKNILATYKSVEVDIVLLNNIKTFGMTVSAVH